MPRASSASTTASRAAPGSEPPWRLEVVDARAPAITATASATQTAIATSSAAGARRRAAAAGPRGSARSRRPPDGRPGARPRGGLVALAGAARRRRVASQRRSRSSRARARARGPRASAIARSTHRARGARGEHLADVAGVAARRSRRTARSRARRRSARARRRPPGARPLSASRARGRRRCSRPAACRRRSHRGVDLARGMRREPDQHVGPDDLADLGDRHVVLADVHAVGAGLARDERAVVDDQQRAERARTARCAALATAASSSSGSCLSRSWTIVDAAGDRRAQQVGQLAAVGRVARDAAHEVQPRRAPGARGARRRVWSRPSPAVWQRPARASPAGRHGARASIKRMPRRSSSPTCSSSAAASIGLAVAWRARAAGHDGRRCSSATALGEGTSRVAAGMLAPVAEVEFGEAGRRVLELGLRSAALWPGFAAELRARPRAWRSACARRARCCSRATTTRRASSSASSPSARSLGLRVERLRPSQAREREPALAPTVRLALEAPDDHSVDPRPVLAALRRACVRAGVQLREHAPVARSSSTQRASASRGVALAGGERRRTPAAGRAGGRAPGAGALRRAAGRERGACPCARSRARSCACATPPARACCSASCASRAATWCRAATAATCSARPSRSAASTLQPDRRRRLRAAARGARAGARRERAGDRGAVGRACARARPDNAAGDRPRARSRA